VQDSLLLEQRPQTGLDSSHFLCLSLQFRHPVFTLLRRGCKVTIGRWGCGEIRGDGFIGYEVVFRCGGLGPVDVSDMDNEKVLENQI
jgi:hypothetical protein